MAAVSWYFSSSVPSQQDRAYTAPSVSGNGNAASGNHNAQTTTYASDAFELRITTGATNSGTYAITKKDVLAFLVLCERWLRDQGGGSDTGSGLDALLKANSATTGIP